MNWINFLHFYQPANIDAYYIEEATKKSYLKVVEALEKNSKTKFTINISGCLFLRWEELKYFDLINRLKKLIKRGQIEITSTSAYHAFLPLLSEKEIIKQIKENENILKKFLDIKKPAGFFLPEMAYSSGVAKIVKKLGYRWLILDEISKNGKLNEVDFNKVYQDENSGLKVVFRSRQFSNSYVPDNLIKWSKENDLIITATDGELYGLRHQDPTNELEKCLKNKKIKTQTISEFIKDNKKRAQKISLIASTWETTVKDLKEKKPYAVWCDKNNKLQMKIWEFANFSQKIIDRHEHDANYVWARWHLVRGLASCTFWWASGKDFSHNFGPQAWSPDEVERGLNEFIRAIRSLHDKITRDTKIKAEKMYVKIKQELWQSHWKKHW